MFKVIQNGVNRLDIEMSGKLNAEEMKIALDELVGKSENIKNGKMLYDIIDYHLPSLSAIAIEFSRLPSMFGFLKKFRRAAVLSDKTWLKKISEFEGALLPGLEIKAFGRDQKAQAEAWLSRMDDSMNRPQEKSEDPKTEIMIQIAELSRLLAMMPADDAIKVHEPLTENQMALSDWLGAARKSFLKLSLLISKELVIQLQ